MSDSERCRASAARYARLADMTNNAEIRRAYLTLERLWIEMASLTETISLNHDQGLRDRLYSLVDDIGQNRQRGLH